MHVWSKLGNLICLEAIQIWTFSLKKGLICFTRAQCVLSYHLIYISTMHLTLAANLIFTFSVYCEHICFSWGTYFTPKEIYFLKCAISRESLNIYKWWLILYFFIFVFACVESLFSSFILLSLSICSVIITIQSSGKPTNIIPCFLTSPNNIIPWFLTSVTNIIPWFLTTLIILFHGF